MVKPKIQEGQRDDTHVPEPGSNRGYAPSIFVDPMVLTLQGGGRVLEDIRELKEEAGLIKLIDQSLLPRSDALGDWLRRMGEGEGLKGLDNVRTIINHRIMKRDGIKEYTLDADATGIEAEKEEALFTYKGHKGYRWKLIQTAGRIISHAGSTILKLSASIEKVELFREIRRKTYETSLSLA